MWLVLLLGVLLLVLLLLLLMLLLLPMPSQMLLALQFRLWLLRRLQQLLLRMTRT